MQGADLVFVTCGMGGGTGTGAAPIVCELAREAGALTVGIVTKPFLFEGRKRMKQAEMGITELRRNVDTMIVVPNERLLAVVGKGIPFQDALKKADEVLLNATRGIASLITSTGIINVDFADVRTVMQNGGAALMGTGVASGENRALEAAQQAISSPLLDNVSINGASGVLINIIGGEDLTLGEATQISGIIHDAVGDEAQIIFGAGNDPRCNGEIRVTVIATGFDRAVTGEPVVERNVNPQVLPFSPRRQPTTPAPPAAPAAQQPAAAPPPRATPAPQPFVRPVQPPKPSTPRCVRHGNSDLYQAANGLMRFQIPRFPWLPRSSRRRRSLRCAATGRGSASPTYRRPVRSW